MDIWEELKNWVFHREDSATQNKMRELEVLQYREIMEKKIGLYHITSGSIEWAVRKALEGEVVCTTDGFEIKQSLVYRDRLAFCELISQNTLPSFGWYIEKEESTAGFGLYPM